MEEFEKNNIKHLDGNRDSPYLIKALIGGVPLSTQVEDFYGFYDSGDKSYLSKDTDMIDGGRDRTGESPDGLIEIIRPFDCEEIDYSKLGYADVRTDHKRWNNKLRVTRVMAQALIGGLGFTGGAMACGTALYFKGKEGVIIPDNYAPITGAISAISLPFYLNAFSKPKGSNCEKGEFYKFERAGRNADHFIRNTYKDYLVKELLSSR